MKRIALKLVTAVAALAAVVGGGAAFAADRLSPQQESDAIVADAAETLGVASEKLEAALQEALANRVDAALADGRITSARAAEMKERIASGELPLVGMGKRGHHGGRGHLDEEAAAAFLGLTGAELRTQLEAGATLSEVATAEGKTQAGLVAALVAGEQAKLAAKVADGRITAERQAEILDGLQARVEGAVTRAGDAGRHGGRGPRGAADDA